jgi:outer membrane murein-binding lipoprotein Lpp
MNTRDVILVGAGVAVGYLLVGYANKTKNNSQLSSNVNTDSNNQITFDCEKMWQEREKTLKGTPEFILKQKNGFLSACKGGKIDFTKDYGNGLFVTYKNDCNEVTKKCPISSVSFNGTTWSWSKEQGKYFKRYNDHDSRPQEITEKQWIEEAISKVPF